MQILLGRSRRNDARRTGKNQPHKPQTLIAMRDARKMLCVSLCIFTDAYELQERFPPHIYHWDDGPWFCASLLILLVFLS